MDRLTRAAKHRVVSHGEWVVEVRGADASDWAGFAMAERQPDDALVLAIYAKEFCDAGYLAASGGLAFALLLEVERHERTVPAILGVWYPSSDNFQVFKRLRRDGLGEAEAARATFTGTEAGRHGYTIVVSVVERDDVVTVRFEPPGARGS